LIGSLRVPLPLTTASASTPPLLFRLLVILSLHRAATKSPQALVVTLAAIKGDSLSDFVPPRSGGQKGVSAGYQLRERAKTGYAQTKGNTAQLSHCSESSEGSRSYSTAVIRRPCRLPKAQAARRESHTCADSVRAIPDSSGLPPRPDMAAPRPFLRVRKRRIASTLLFLSSVICWDATLTTMSTGFPPSSKVI
jgi:hypothetical protein